MPGSLRSAGFALLAAGLALGACGSEPKGPPNLVLVSIDSLRADRLGSYGAERATSPALDALAAEGTRFAEAVAPTSWTLPSHVTLFTGLPLRGHRVRRPDHRIDSARHLLAEHLRSLGYRTAAFVSAPFLHRAYGFARGFEVYENFHRPGEAVWPPDEDVHAASHTEETAPAVVAAALRWLSEQPVGGDAPPWFLFVHLWDVHYDYIPPSPYDRLFDPDYAGSLDPRGYAHNRAIHPGMPARDLRYLRALYDGEIRWSDSHLQHLLDALRAREARERILLAVVSDHGEEFFEHGSKGHFKNLFEESVRVPWILRYPGVVPAGAVLEGATGLVDVAPTLLGLAGLPPLPEARGEDHAAAVRAGTRVEGEEILSLEDLVALRGSGWKIVANRTEGGAHFFDLVADPGERDPRPAGRVAPQRLGRLERRLREELRHARSLRWAGDGSADLDAATRESLRALGYLE